MQQFKIRDLAVYPAQGIAEITGIETREIGGIQELYYVLRVLGTQKHILVPVRKVHAVGLRKLVSEQEAKRILDEVLTDHNIVYERETWNRRYRRYMEKINTGDLALVAEVYRDISVLKNRKNLSYGEKKMLELAGGLLVQELAAALNRSEEEVEAELEALFKPRGETDTKAANPDKKENRDKSEN